jgi:Protein of unknown function (DUF1499)
MAAIRCHPFKRQAQADMSGQKNMLRSIRYFTLVGLIAAAALLAHAALTSREESLLAVVYETLFGPPDLGPVDFETFTRGSQPNTALACPPGFCRNAVADFDPGVFPGSDEDLRARFTAFALEQPRVIPVYRDASPGLPMQDRYVQRSAMLAFPDTLDVRFIALSDRTSTLAVYSRSQIGYSDRGVNLARIRLWTTGAMARGTGG